MASANYIIVFSISCDYLLPELFCPFHTWLVSVDTVVSIKKYANCFVLSWQPQLHTTNSSYIKVTGVHQSA